jgi:hypothetical protein
MNAVARVFVWSGWGQEFHPLINPDLPNDFGKSWRGAGQPVSMAPEQLRGGTEMKMQAYRARIWAHQCRG